MTIDLLFVYSQMKINTNFGLKQWENQKLKNNANWKAETHKSMIVWKI